jgi:hypothetical protein
MDACYKLGTSFPDFVSLSEVTGISKRQWHYQFKSPIFVIQLKTILRKKHSQAKTKEKKVMYKSLMDSLDEKVHSLY